MFQSIKYKRYLGYNDATKQYQYEYELIDSDFSCVAVEGGPQQRELTAGAVAVVIQEYSKRKLNVATNLVRCFRFCEKRYGLTIANQIAWAEKYQHQFTPKLKAELAKYLTLL